MAAERLTRLPGNLLSRLEAQQQVARALAGARTTEVGINGALNAVGDILGWQYAGFWIIDEDHHRATCAATWQSDGIEGQTFADLCTRSPVVCGTGLIGSVWQSRQAIWIANARKATGSRTGMEFGELDIGTAIGIPIQIDGRMAGIVAFLATTVRERDIDMFTTLESIGNQIGQFSERKRTEMALRESEDRVRVMLNSAPVLLWIAEPDGRISWFNNGWLSYTGRSMEQEQGRGWIDGIHPDDRDEALSAIDKAFQAREPFDLEFRLRRSDGEYSWIVDRGVPRFDANRTFAGFIGSSLDISERKRHEQDQAFLSEATSILTSSLDYRETLASVSNLAVPTIADWCIVYAIGNRGGIEQLAISPPQPTGAEDRKSPLDPIPLGPGATTGIVNVIEAGQPLLIATITPAAIAEHERNDDDLALLSKIGAKSVMIHPIIARERVLGGIALMVTEQERRYDRNDLALIQHLARRSAVAIDNAMLFREAQGAAQARDQFLAVAAHELRSPLTSMKGFAQLLLRRAKRMPGGAEWITPLQTIDTQVNRVTTLVSRLLDVSRIEEKRLQLQCEDVDMVDVVRNAAVEAQLATEDHTIIARFAVDELTVSIDRTRIEQVLANLLDNAMKYSPEGTSIEIMLQVDEHELTVAVSDEGPGISREAQQRMFERYFRGSSSSRAATEGLGLGLYVSHGIVTAHGGRMWVESDAANGSTFWFSLPRTASTTGQQHGTAGA